MPYCVECRSEYEPGVERCLDCDSPLVDTMPPENPDVDPDASLVEIYSASGDSEALVIKGLLESEGIMCSLSSDIPHSVFPVEIDGLGAVRISVSNEDADRAGEIISSHQKEDE